jgi:hypothetical protein
VDHIVRSAHRAGYRVVAVVEKMPVAGGAGQLPVQLEAVRRSIMRVVRDVYDLLIVEVAPGTWKPSRSARTRDVPDEWHGKKLSPHQRDALHIAWWYMDLGTED